MLSLAAKKIFPAKVFKFGGVKKKYSPVYQFFDCNTKFDNKPREKILFVCKIHSCKEKAKIGESTNLIKHLATHGESRKWCKMFSLNKNIIQRDKLTEGKLNLIKFFISSNQSMLVLENDWLRLLISPSVEISSYHYFRNFFLNEVTDMVTEAISAKLANAFSLTIIPDIWEHNGDHYLGLGGTVIYDNFEKEIYILGITEVLGNSAEHIKPAIEFIVDKFTFDKAIARGKF